MKLRVIDFGMVPALRSQAVYHGLAETIGPDSDRILSLVSPQTPYVCVGMHQEVAKEVDEDFCKASNLPIYRRHVGGGAVYLDENQLFTHFIYPRDKAPEFAVNLYPQFIEPVVRTYKELGINANYRPVNDIHVDGRKIGGTGAASIGEATVMVGSFMLDFDTETMSKCLKVPSEKFRDKLRQTLDDYMTTMAKELGQMPERADIKARFLKHCADVLKVEPVYDQPTEEELAAIARAEAELADPYWTYMKARRSVAHGVKISEHTHISEGGHKAPGGMIRTRLVSHDGKVQELDISGDFTCLPPEGIDMVAAALSGCALDEAALAAVADAALEGNGIEMPGVTGADIAKAVMAATAQP
jgi:lipoate-protein ligase A